MFRLLINDDALPGTKTVIIIAHRLSTIGFAHRILVIVDGRIVEEGLHEDLLNRGGEYHKLYRMQFAENHRRDGG